MRWLKRIWSGSATTNHSADISNVGASARVAINLRAGPLRLAPGSVRSAIGVVSRVIDEDNAHAALLVATSPLPFAGDHPPPILALQSGHKMALARPHVPPMLKACARILNDALQSTNSRAMRRPMLR
jgi:hypothetical protein